MLKNKDYFLILIKFANKFKLKYKWQVQQILETD